MWLPSGSSRISSTPAVGDGDRGLRATQVGFVTGFDVGPVGDPTSVEVCPADPNQGDVTVVQSPVDADAEA